MSGLRPNWGADKVTQFPLWHISVSLLERVMEPVECNPAASGVNIHGLTIKDLQYADDVDLLAEEEKWPEEWTKSVLVTIPKKGDLTDCARPTGQLH